MTTDQACATLAQWLRDDPHGAPTTPSLVVRMTRDGLVYEMPKGFTVDEAAALAAWVRAATR